MDKGPILVVGATGQQGGAVAKSLLAQGESVRGMSRDPSKVKAFEAVFGQLNDRASLDQALKGIKRAFLVTTFMEEGMDAEVKHGINFIDAAKAAGVEHLVFSSVGASDRNTGIPHFDTKWLIEQHLYNSGIPYTVLRPVFFMQNFASPWFLPSIQQGKLVLPVRPDVKIKMIPLEVIGNFVALAFQRPEEFIGQTIEIASDELTFPEAMEILSKVSGKMVVYEQLPSEQAVGLFGEDIAKMFNWFNGHQFQADLEALRNYGIHLTTFKEHVQAASWAQLNIP